jgi:hypothetical protein
VSGAQTLLAIRCIDDVIASLDKSPSICHPLELAVFDQKDFQLYFRRPFVARAESRFC